MLGANENRTNQIIESNPEKNSDISYELRTPLASIQGALGLLISGQLGEMSIESRRMLEIAINNTNRILRLMAALEQQPNRYNDLLPHEEIAQLRLENSLYSALRNQEFQVYYQPIVNLHSNQLLGFEALLRWKNPSLGLISPSIFVPLIEANGLIQSIGLWVLQEACRQMHFWQQHFSQHSHLRISVNLAAQQLASPELPHQITSILQTTGFNPHNLKLEITESAAMKNSFIASTNIHMLKQMGIQFYIDDFGTGYSSLSRLHELPIDVLKIDRSFIDQMHLETGKIQIIQSIVRLAWDLGIDVIAEGIETAEQYHQLKCLGCNQGQGYLFSKPMSVQDTEDFMTRYPGDTTKK